MRGLLERPEFAFGDPNDDERVSDRTELVRSLGSKLAAAIKIKGRRGARLAAAAAAVSPSWF